MKNIKVIKVSYEGLVFNDGTKLYSDHYSECCEHHELTFTDLTIDDFKDLEFDLTNDNFFKKIPDYGIELIPLKGFSVRIPGHGYNNGFYGTNIELIIENAESNVFKNYDITECQVVFN